VTSLPNHRKEPLNGQGALRGAQLVSEQPLSEGERWRLGLGGMVQLAVTLAGVRVVRSRLRTRPALQGTGAGTAPTSRAPAQGRSGGAVSIDWKVDLL